MFRRMQRHRERGKERETSAMKRGMVLCALGCAGGMGFIMGAGLSSGKQGWMEPEGLLKGLLNEDKYRALVENSSDIISLIDAQGTILYKSASITRILGFHPSELVGLSAFAVAHPDDHAHLMGLFTELMKNPDKLQVGEFRHLHKNGSYRWVEGVASNMLANPEVKAIVFNYRDISERKQAAAALEEIRSKLRRHAEELEKRVVERTAELEESLHSLEGILYHVAHDLRAPLRAIDGYTSILLDFCGSECDPRAKEAGNRISSSAKHMDELIQDLLEYGRLGHVELRAENVDLETSVALVLGRMAEDIEKKKARIIVTNPLPYAWAHPRTLEQVLSNLLENAMKFVAPGITPEIQIWAESNPNRVRLFIKDNGIGIPPEYQNRIFQVFERLDVGKDYPGTGIGLAIVRKAVERMGGSIMVHSKPGTGSCFSLDIPSGTVRKPRQV